MSSGGEWLEVISAWALLGFLITAYLGVYLFFSGTLTQTLKDSHIELTAVITKVKQRIVNHPAPSKIGKSDEDALTT